MMTGSPGGALQGVSLGLYYMCGLSRGAAPPLAVLLRTDRIRGSREKLSQSSRGTGLENPPGLWQIRLEGEERTTRRDGAWAPDVGQLLLHSEGTREPLQAFRRGVMGSHRGLGSQPGGVE